MDEGQAARDAALHFEAVKTSMRQDKDGSKITLAIHPSQVPVDLFAAPTGTRFMVAMVIVGDDERPVKGRDTTEGERAVQSAAMLCRNPKFQKWLEARGFAMMADEASAADAIRAFCNIDSRSELATNHAARTKFLKLREAFENEFTR